MNEIRLVEIEREMNDLAQHAVNQPEDPDADAVQNAMAELISETENIKSGTLAEVVVKARIADAYNFHDPEAELDTGLSDSIVRDLIRLASELTPA